MFGASSLNRKGHLLATILCAVILLVVFYLFYEQRFPRGVMIWQTELLYRRIDKANPDPQHVHGNKKTIDEDTSDEGFHQKAAYIKKACERFQEKLNKDEIEEDLKDRSYDIERACEKVLEKLDKLHRNI